MGNLRKTFSPFAVLFFGLTLTFVAWYHARQYGEMQKQVRFQEVTNDIYSAIDQRLRMNINILVQSRGLFSSFDGPSARQFRDYVSNMRVTEIYKGMQGVGYAPRLSARQ